MNNSSLAIAFTRLEMDTEELAGYPPNMLMDDVVFMRDQVASQLENLRNRLAENSPSGEMPHVLKAVLSNADVVLRETLSREQTT